MLIKSSSACLLVLFFVSFSPLVLSQPLTPEEMEEWLFDDSDSIIDNVNEGQLVFLDAASKQSVHHHHNTMLITDTSIEDGWVGLEQCHRNLDPVGLAQIVFRADRVRGLEVMQIKNIDKAWVEGPSVQLEGVHSDAVLCIRAETRSFVYNGDGTFSLHSGPFMRRFLDGYYPMKVTLDVIVKSKNLRFYRMLPTDQKGFSVTQSNNDVHFEALFEGRLSTEIMFHDLSLGNITAQKEGHGRIAIQGQ